MVRNTGLYSGPGSNLCPETGYADRFFVVFLNPSRKITVKNLQLQDPGSSVSIVSGYGLDNRAIEVRSPAEAKGFFL
jgi:hypothetical protein